MEIELWKDIPNYEGIYQVSTMGRVRSLDRIRSNGHGLYTQKGRILKLTQNGGGYKQLVLSKKGVLKTIFVHQLMAITYLGHKLGNRSIVVDHINNDKTDNRISNIQVISNRENSSKDKKGGSSQYVGVRKQSHRRKWSSTIKINGKDLFLGNFKTELEAAKAYQNKLKEIENGKG